MNGTLAGLIGVETRVILRRRSLWIALIPAYLVVTLLAVTSPGLNTGDGAGRVADWATMFNMLLGLVFSATFVGALGVRGDDGLSQLQRSTPTAMWKQLLARVAGTLTVTLPVLAILLALGIYLGVTDGAWISVPAAVAVYLLLTLPAVILILGIAALLEALLPTAFARVGAVILWAWAALFDTPTIPGPSLAGTVFSPTGESAAAALFASEASMRTFTTGFAALNIGVLLLLGGLGIVLAGQLGRNRPR